MTVNRQVNLNTESVDNYLKAILTLRGPEDRRVSNTALASFPPWHRASFRNEHAAKAGAGIVNDMSEINIDARLVDRSSSALSRVDEKLVEMTNGCICCTLRDDWLKEVSRLARERRFDYLLIESAGISGPLPVAMTFTFEDETGKSLSDVAERDTLVTVSEDEWSVSDLLIDQVEFANVIVINKCDLVNGEERERLAQIHHLHQRPSDSG